MLFMGPVWDSFPFYRRTVQSQAGSKITRDGSATDTKSDRSEFVFRLVPCKRMKRNVWRPIRTQTGLSSSRSHVITPLKVKSFAWIESAWVFNVGLLFLMISISKINDSSFPCHFLRTLKLVLRFIRFKLCFWKKYLPITECLCSSTRWWRWRHLYWKKSIRGTLTRSWIGPFTQENKTLCERIFGRGCTMGMILWTCLIGAKELSSYLTREDKSFTPLVCWTTQLIQYVPIHNKNSVISRQCLKICRSSMQTYLEPNCNIGHKWLQPRE